MTSTTKLTGERADILETLGKHRYFLRKTCEGISDAQATEQSTISELTLGGLIHHVADTEASWAEFARSGAMAGAGDWSDAEPSPEVVAEWEGRFRLQGTLAEELANYAEVARRTDELVATMDLDTAHPLPAAPWFPPDAKWTARRVFLHIVAETSQHAGHADIIREAIDGQKSMG